MDYDNEYAESTEPVEGEVKERPKGLIVQSDDLELGEYYAILGLKDSDQPIPVAGQSFKVTAIYRPFIVVELAVPGGHAPVTLDTRLFDFIKPDEAFVKAQIGNVVQFQGNPLEALFGQLRRGR